VSVTPMIFPPQPRTFVSSVSRSDRRIAYC
jgi:hypothetical protein